MNRYYEFNDLKNQGWNRVNFKSVFVRRLIKLQKLGKRNIESPEEQ